MMKKLTWKQLSDSLHRRYLMAEWQLRELMKEFGIDVNSPGWNPVGNFDGPGPLQKEMK